MFLDGGSSQERLADALRGLPVLWVGVRCAPDVAVSREHHRRDRGARDGAASG
ncbi:MAG: phosphotransferase-like protein [Acidimicrobiales bacterium]